MFTSCPWYVSYICCQHSNQHEPPIPTPPQSSFSSSCMLSTASGSPSSTSLGLPMMTHKDMRIIFEATRHLHPQHAIMSLHAPTYEHTHPPFLALRARLSTPTSVQDPACVDLHAGPSVRRCACRTQLATTQVHDPAHDNFVDNPAHDDPRAQPRTLHTRCANTEGGGCTKPGQCARGQRGSGCTLRVRVRKWCRM
jgi:hypothetical protein